MTRVLFLIDTLRGGGAERVLVNLVNNMDHDKYDITVETLFDGGINRERLTDKVKYFCRNAPYPRGIGYVFSCFSSRRLYKYFVGKERYDVIIAYMHGAATKIIAGCPDKSVKRITWLHTGKPESSSMFDFWFSKKAAYKAYASCDAVVGISNTVKNAFSDYTGITKGLRVVYNTNECSWIEKQAEADADMPFRKKRTTICSVGRACEQKGYDRLINVSKRLHDEGFDFDLAVAGDGECLDSLRKQVKELNAEDYIYFLGMRENPYSVVAFSDLFICSSRQEGLSTAVSEAIILGKPVVSTDVSGAKEILGENNEYGLVIENSEDGIYLGLKRFLEEPSLTEHYARKARERAVFFNTESTVGQAQKLIDEIAGK